MSYAITLEQLLSDRNQTLFGRLNEIKERAESLLTYANASFPYFTPHNFKHSKSVVVNLNWILPDDLKPKLNEHEIFFLIIAAWLHDWGMVCSPNEGVEKLEDIRKTHHVRTYENFLALYDKLGLNRHEADIAGRIARGHRVDDLNNDFFDEQIFSTNIHIRVRFLAALLRIADECDVTFNRMPELLYYSLNPSGASKEFFDTNLDIRGVGLDRPRGHRIEVTALATDPKMAHVLRLLKEKMQRELDQVKGILALNGLELDYVDVKIFNRGFIDKPIAFRLDETRITELLVGEALYSDKTVAIRELLQNSVDACRSRFKDPSLGQIRIYREGDDLIVSDNGEGMDFETAYDFLARKGFSYYKSMDFQKAHPSANFDPISKWGLGILSCFIIASSAIIETQREGKEPCRFLIPSLGEGWRYEKGSKSQPGTSVRLTLKPTFKSMDLDKLVRHFVKSSKVPIYLGKDSSAPLQFDWTFDDPDVAPREKRNDKKLNVGREWRFSDESVTVRLYQVSGAGDMIYVANQGFFVGELEVSRLRLPLPPSSVALITAEKDVLDLDVSRDRIISDNPKFNAFSEKWISIILGFLREEMGKPGAKADQTETDKTYRWQEASSEFNLGIQRVVEGLRPAEASVERIPNSLRHFVLKELPFLTLTREGLKTSSFEDAIKAFPKKITLYHSIARSLTDFQIESGFVDSELRNGIGPEEVIIFGIWSQRDSPGFVESIRKIFSLQENATALDLLTLVQRKNFDVVRDNGLQSLLCPFSIFATFPKELRASVLCRRPFRIQLPPNGDTVSGSWTAVLSIMIGAHDLSMKADAMENVTPQHFISRLFAGQTLDGLKGVNIVENGEIMFDAGDPFMTVLAKNDKTITGHSTLTKMVGHYFSALASFFLSPSQTAYDSLTSKEEEICDLLGTKYPGDLKSRVGPLTEVLLNTNALVVVPMLPSAFVTIDDSTKL